MSGAELPGGLSGDPGGPGAPPPELEPEDGPLARLAAKLTSLAERWIPDAFLFALVGTFVVVALAAATAKVGPLTVIKYWGDGFWDLLAFTLQMSLVIITGYVLATTRPVFVAIQKLAGVPKTAKGAVAFVALFAMLSSWVNWGFSLIFSAMLAKEVARRVPRVDYRALASGAFLGLGSVWAQGLSGSAALQMATPTAMPKEVRAIIEHGGAVPGGIIPLSSTIFLWQSLVSVVVEIVVVTTVVYLAAPSGARAKTAEELGIPLGASPLELPEPPRRGTPGEWLEHQPWVSWLFVALAGTYLVALFVVEKKGVAGISLNVIILGFLTLGALLHGTPARLMRAFSQATPGVWGVILQFPFYAGLAAVITKTHLSESIARFFVGISTPTTFPAVIAVYSMVLGVFVPSGGSKWVIEAPYVMQAAHDLHVHLGWMVAVYDLGEAVANLVQPFWMVPVLGLFGLKAKDVMGHTFLVALVLFPLVLAMVVLLGRTLSYPL